MNTIFFKAEEQTTPRHFVLIHVIFFVNLARNISFYLKGAYDIILPPIFYMRSNEILKYMINSK